MVGNRSHPMSQVIYACLEEMMKRIEKLGYTEERSISSISEPKKVSCDLWDSQSASISTSEGDEELESLSRLSYNDEVLVESRKERDNS